MGRTTVYNKITDVDKLSKINSKNKQLMNDFLEYLISIDRAKGTIKAYKNDLEIFFCWNFEFNDNKYFIDLSKREIARFQSYVLNTWKWSPKRIRRVKSSISSFSNYIESILDDEAEFKNFRSIVRKIESPADQTVREKTVFTDKQLDFLLNTLAEKGKYIQACALALGIASGRRKAELCRFKVDYFNNDNIIYGSLWKTPETITTKGRGSRGKQLIVYTLVNQFKPYLDLWIKERERLNITTQWLLPKKVGSEYINAQMDISTLDSYAQTFSNILGMDFYWHSLRHFFTTNLSKCGLPDEIIKQIVGWESNDMVSLYKDISMDEELAKYFDINGIKQTSKSKLSDL